MVGKAKFCLREQDLYWLAGILEGEGCFRLKSSAKKKSGGNYIKAVIELNMTDQDVILKAFEIAGVGKVYGPYRKSRDLPHYKSMYNWTVGKESEALQLMLILRPLMGERRGAKIDEILAARWD